MKINRTGQTDGSIEGRDLAALLAAGDSYEQTANPPDTEAMLQRLHVPRLLMAVDIHGNSQRDTRGQLLAQRDLSHALDQAATEVGLDRRRWTTQAGGGGELAILPTDIDPALVAGDFAGRLVATIGMLNQRNPDHPRLRARLAMHRSTLTRSPLGSTGHAVLAVKAMLGDEELHRQLHEHPAHDLGYALSASLYDQVVRTGCTAVLPEAVQPIRLHPKIDSSVPNSARIWNYWMGGRENYPVDRAAGDEYAVMFPGVVALAKESRRFLVRVVRKLAAEAGIRQFLDIGTGLPAMLGTNTHEVAQGIAPDARVVYVDNDPLVLRFAEALLCSTTSEGATSYIDADVRDPEQILAETAKTLDFTEPIAVMLMGVLGHVPEYDEARTIVRRLMAAMPSGSYLAHYDGTDTAKGFRQAQQRYDRTGAVPYVLRSPKQIAGLFDGLEILDPGVVSLSLWHPDHSSAIEPVDGYGAVARKP